MKWIEIISGFECNCRCRVCPSSSQAATSRMSGEELAGWLEEGRRRGAENVWFGGGEPTLHPKLIESVELARSLGYQRIRIQTNGLRFAYLPFTRRCLKAGANEFSMSVKGAGPQTHDYITQHPGSFALMTAGIRNLVSCGARVEADVLITRRSMNELAEIVETFAGLSVSSFTFWLVSLHGMDEKNVRDHLPRLSWLMPQLERAFEAADRLGVRATSLHTPPCVCQPDYRRRYAHAGTWELAVVTPGSEPFAAEESVMEGGAYLQGCHGCGMRSGCLGPREDYLRIFGPGEFSPIGDTKK